jgi:hypothetical protein
MKACHLAAAALLALPLIGCSTVRIEDARGVRFVARVPAWPWQDSLRALERLNISTRTNGTTTIAIRGLNETEATGSNAVELVSRTAGAVVRAAIEAAK